MDINRNSEEPVVNVSFAGCGFLGIYHVGVACALRQYAPQLIINKVAGASAGAIAACGLICDMCLGQATTDVLKIVIQARKSLLGPLHPSFQLVDILKEGLNRNLPDDAHIRATGRLHISLTRYIDGQNVIVNHFDSKQELIDALICSAFIPFYCGAVPPTFKGVRYIDGGWSDNLPQLNDNTITVSPFSGECDICPQDIESQSFLSFDINNTNIRFTSRNAYRFSVALLPPHPEVMSEMCREGFEDTLRFLARTDLFSCSRCIEIRSSIKLEEPETGSVEIAAEAEKKHVRRMCSHRRLQSVKSVGKFIDSTQEKDCETCKLAQNTARTTGLPHAVKKTLLEAEATERTWYKYIMDMRFVRWMRFMALPWILPWDISYAVLKKVCGNIPLISSGGRQLAKKAWGSIAVFLEMVDEKCQKTHQRLICQMAITDFNYSSLSSDPFAILAPGGEFSWYKQFLPPSPRNGRTSPMDVVDNQEQAPPATAAATTPTAATAAAATAAAVAAASAAVDMVPALERRHSLIDSISEMANACQCTVTSMNFGFQVDLEPDNHHARSFKDVVQRDDCMKRDVGAYDVTSLAGEVELEGLSTASHITASFTAPPSPVFKEPNVEVPPPTQENFDTYSAILNFTRNRDALLAYYYTDDDNTVKITQIFDCEDARQSTDTASLQSTSGQPKLRKFSACPSASLNSSNVQRPSPTAPVVESSSIHHCSSKQQDSPSVQPGNGASLQSNIEGPIRGALRRLSLQRTRRLGSNTADTRTPNLSRLDRNKEETVKSKP